MIISVNIHVMSRQFIIGEHVSEAVKQLKRMRGDSYGAVVDVNALRRKFAPMEEDDDWQQRYSTIP